MRKSKVISAKKFVIGTANFNMKYGLNNKKNFFKKKTINKILNIAKKNKIFYLDTARTYNNVEKVLGNFNLDKFKIITKIKNIKLNKNIYNFIQNDILKSIYDLRIKNFYGLLILIQG